MRHRLFLPWTALSAWCVLLMWAFPGGEVIPFHAIWISFALLYGFEAWPLRPTLTALGVLAVLTGGILVHRAAAGSIAWEEVSEIPLMLGLAVLVLWHVRRRQQALTTVTVLARREVEAAGQRERLARLTSHEMRTPLTIAGGYVDLLLAEEQDPSRRADLEVVRDELGRLSRAGNRLLRMIRLQDLLERSPVDVDALLTGTARRWAGVVSRTWLVESDGGVVEASPERLRACLDTLIENAVRYTDRHGSVRLLAFRHGDLLCLGVADSGPGLSPAQRLCLNAREDDPARDEDPTAPDPHSQTGLGLGIVREVVEARGGRVLAGRSREGGALVLLTLPQASRILSNRSTASRNSETSSATTSATGRTAFIRPTI